MVAAGLAPWRVGAGLRIGAVRCDAKKPARTATLALGSRGSREWAEAGCGLGGERAPSPARWRRNRTAQGFSWSRAGGAQELLDPRLQGAWLPPSGSGAGRARGLPRPVRMAESMGGVGLREARHEDPLVPPHAVHGS